jgi:hypothetical protein
VLCGVDTLKHKKLADQQKNIGFFVITFRNIILKQKMKIFVGVGVHLSHLLLLVLKLTIFQFEQYN